MNRRTRAKLAFRLGGYLSRIKTPQRCYELVHTDDGDFESRPVGRIWTSCVASVRLEKLSMRLDWDHWDHWALIHDDCDPTPCPECGGCVCDELKHAVKP